MQGGNTPQMQSYLLVMGFQAKLICFDMYESIFGGGAELPITPIIIIIPIQQKQIA